MQNGIPISWPSLPNAVEHGGSILSMESWDNMTPALMQKNIKAIQKAYQQVTGGKCGCQQ
jgi:hypothetical protein